MTKTKTKKSPDLTREELEAAEPSIVNDGKFYTAMILIERYEQWVRKSKRLALFGNEMGLARDLYMAEGRRDALREAIRILGYDEQLAARPPMED